MSVFPKDRRVMHIWLPQKLLVYYDTTKKRPLFIFLSMLQSHHFISIIPVLHYTKF